jgi:hypothetical protein
MTRILTAAALAASCAMLAAGAAYAGDSMLKSGDEVKQIEQDRQRLQQEQQSGRSATEKPTTTETGAPISPAEKEKNMLQGVDPAVK